MLQTFLRRWFWCSCSLYDASLLLTAGLCHGLYCSLSFVCVEVLRPIQPNGFISSAVSLPNHIGQA